MLTFHQALALHRPTNATHVTWTLVQRSWDKRTTNTNNLMTEAEALAFFDPDGPIWPQVVKETNLIRRRIVRRLDKRLKNSFMEVGLME